MSFWKYNLIERVSYDINVLIFYFISLHIFSIEGKHTTAALD
ncbi:hypothetical protein [Candidatus Blochmannia sp. SNP]